MSAPFQLRGKAIQILVAPATYRLLTVRLIFSYSQGLESS